MLSASFHSLGLRARAAAPNLDYAFASALSADDRALYDAVIEQEKGSSYTQTRAWADVARNGRALSSRFLLVRRAGEVIGAALVLQPQVLGIRAPTAIVERGPVARSIDDLADVLVALRRACRARGIVRLCVMPYWEGADAMHAERILEEQGFVCAQDFTSAHARTVRLALDDRLPSDVRAELRRAERAGATARSGGARDVAAFERLHDALMREQGLPAKPRAWFDALVRYPHGALFVCEHEGEVIGAVFVVRHGRLATYVAGAATRAPRSFGKTAPAMAAAIDWARAQGCTTFDLGGIPLDGDSDPKRQRIARFKRSFARTPLALTRKHERWF